MSEKTGAPTRIKTHHKSTPRYTDIFAKFSSLKFDLESETKYSSDFAVVYNNKNYKDIIKLGVGVAPFLLNDLIENKGNWFDALSKLYKVNPVKEEHRGDMEAMIKDWSDWKEKS